MSHHPNHRGAQGTGWNRRRFLSTLGGGALGASLLAGADFFAPSIAQGTEGSKYPDLEFAVSTGGVIASVSKYATDIGIDVLDQGGNAVDAAVATVFALGVTRPEYCGIGGCGMLVYRSKSGELAALDFQGSAPATYDAETCAGPGMHRDPNVVFGEEESGHRVVGVPGLLAGMAAALERFGSGRFSLEELIAPAEVLAREGFEISDELALWIFLEKSRLLYYQETAEIFLTADLLWPIPGQKLVQTDYAKSLRLIMEDGPDAFYRGWIAEQIDQDMEDAEANARLNPVLLANGPRWGGFSNDKGLLTYDDLANYRAIWREPITVNYRGHQVVAMPPSGSGVIVAEMLNILEGYDLAEFGHSSADYLHVLAEAQKIAYGDCALLIADPDLHDEVAFNTEVLTSKTYARRRRADIDMQQARQYEATPLRRGAHTNHMSALDREGNAVAFTTTQGAPFGSVVTVPGTGMLLNDQVGAWVNMPGINKPVGGARRRSSMSPAIVVRSGQPILVTGGAGGTFVPMGIAEQVLNVVEFGMGIDRDVDAERIDAVNFSLEQADKDAGFVDVLAIESGGNRPLDPEVKQSLTDRDHKVKDDLGEYGMAPPSIQSVGVALMDGLRIAVCDPRYEGAAGGE